MTDVKIEGKEMIREFQKRGKFKSPGRVLEVLLIILGDDYHPSSEKAAYHILYSQLES